MENKYDLIIIGGGPAGLTAGLYAGRARLKTLILEKLSCGGQILLTETVENYPGFPGGISSSDLMGNIEEQVMKLGVKILEEEVKQLEKAAVSWRIKTAQAQYDAKAVIVAVGSVPKTLGVEGEKLLMGKGVSYCATCDGPLYRNKTVAVVGGGDTAAEEALFLTRFAAKIFLVHRRSSLRATEILAQRLKENTKVSPVWNSVVKEISGQNKVEAIVIKDANTGKEEKLFCDGVFIYVGRSPDTGFLANLVNLDEHGHIITDTQMRTSQAGIFAAGDCRKKILRQVITACSDGAVAVHCAQQYLSKTQ
ncbi:MAG: thioredoxin-disulfide reductase [Candidatus Omnitrophota bacterium]|nr:thioredoxin-disulfide reductase [Candidatus Omnitrophota bacterium]